MRRALCLGLAACGGGQGDWVVQTWGEDYIEQQIPAEVFTDGCSVRYDTFEVSFARRQLLDGNGEVAGELPPAEIYDLTTPGPVSMGSVSVLADHYSRIAVEVDAVEVEGTLSCAGEDKVFRWAFDEHTVYDCEPADLTIPTGGEDRTELTVHGDHLFYDGLASADAAVRGEPLLEADADGDGEITLAELEAVSVPALGYGVGPYSDVLDLRSFVSHLARTLVHVDGEGECLVDL
jgi:hypothetical protein